VNNINIMIKIVFLFLMVTHKLLFCTCVSVFMYIIIIIVTQVPTYVRINMNTKLMTSLRLLLLFFSNNNIYFSTWEKKRNLYNNKWTKRLRRLPTTCPARILHIIYIILALTRKIINHSSISQRLGVNTHTRACA